MSADDKTSDWLAKMLDANAPMPDFGGLEDHVIRTERMIEEVQREQAKLSGTIVEMLNNADTLRELGLVCDASDLTDEALRLVEQRFPTSHPVYELALLGKYQVSAARENVVMALECCAEMLQITEMEINDKGKSVERSRWRAHALYYLGKCQYKLGDKSGLDLMWEALEITSRMAFLSAELKTYHMEMVGDFGMFMSLRKNTNAGETALQKALTEFGVDQSTELQKASYLMTLALCHVAKKEMGDAEKTLCDAIDIYRATKELGCEGYLAEAISLLAQVYCLGNHYARARETVDEGLRICRLICEYFGTRKVNVILGHLLATLGYIETKTGRLKEAEDALSEAVNIVEETYGAESERTLRIKNSLMLIRNGATAELEKDLESAKGLMLACTAANP